MKNDAKSQWSDAKLICYYLDNDNDQDVFAVLCKRYEVRLLQFVTDLVKNSSDAEEIVQDTFVKVSQCLEDLKDAGKLLSWMFSIARQQVQTWARENSKRIKFEPISIVSEQTLHAVAVTEDRLGQQRERDEALLECVLRLAKDLSKQQRAALYHQLKGLKYEGIAEKLGVSVGAVKKLLYHARKRLKEQIPEEVWFYED